MVSLYDKINESLSQEWREKLQALIDSDTLDDKTAKKMLGIAKVVSSDDVEALNNFFVFRGIDDDMRNIIRILKDYDVMDELYEMIKDPSSMPDSSEFIKSDNVYSLFGKINSSFSKDLFAELAVEKPSRNSITRGMFEILCQMFLRDIAEGNSSKNLSGHGDVNTSKYSLEFKTPGARVKSQKEHPATLIDYYLESQIRSNSKVNLKGRLSFKDIMSSQDSIVKFVSNIDGLTEDEWFDLFAGALFAQYGVSDWKSLIQYDKIKKDVLSNFNNPKNFAKSLIRLMGSIQLRFYQIEENWSHIVIFKGVKGSEAVHRGDYACIPGDYARDITKVYFDKHFNFTGGGNGHGSVRDHYCQVTYK